MSHISLFLWERKRTYCKLIHTTAVLRSTSSFLGYTSKYSTAIYEVYSGEGRIRCFWEKYEVLRPAPLPPKTGHPQACPTRVVVRTKSPTVEDRHRNTRGAENSRATTAVLALPVLLPVRVRGSFRTDTY